MKRKKIKYQNLNLINNKIVLSNIYGYYKYINGKTVLTIFNNCKKKRIK